MFAFLKRARKSLIRLGFGLAALGLAACEPMTGGGPLINTGGTVQVALLVPAGSTQQSDNLLAKSLENAARLAIADLNGVKIDLRVYPTAGNPQQATQAATQAINDGAKIILGPVYAQAANAAGVVAAARGINVLAFSNNPSIAGGNVFILGQTFSDTASRLMQYAVSQGKTKIAVVHDTTTAGQMADSAITNAIASAGATKVADDTYQYSQNGVVQAAPTIANDIKNANTDAVFLAANTAGALPLLTQLLSENGVDSKTEQFIGLTRWDIPQSTLSLPGVQGAWFALPDPSMSQQFAARYAQAYGNPPLPITGLAYDGIAAIGALIKAGKSNALTAQALTQPSGFVGVNGIFRLLPNGTNQRGLAVAQIVNNQVQVIDPAPRSFGGAGL
ncbi:ABC transporter substrate-binding protein [Defluviimonas sp. 20V17]|uniref:Amino acid/amide ABC transporter substrate-binding protein, HAAT family n=1 Tax=Allgaiera indica TaxID=765699 RepID=A0AAN4UNN6_9RHOB|nr:penicillin-binding protein activator [Allgaiera indica]KDB05698.1 ABC transporter substrate-binding protein [Defluviimonas sp. 20V17]GHD98954.1 penicillin-binding protein activator [Allgaiera indica]SDW02820.1 amino acid/amide ABC transporter substrate-binding protein, HAAT family [Allgaiera indica]